MQVPVTEGPKVNQAPLPATEVRVVAGPGAFGASIGEGVQQAANALGEIGAQVKREADSNKVTEILGVTTGLANAETSKVTSRKLDGAKGIADELNATLEKLKEDALGAAENQTQKDILSRQLTNQNLWMVQSARAHELSQLDDYHKLSADLSIKEQVKIAYDNPLNMDGAGLAKATAAATVRALYSYTGPDGNPRLNVSTEQMKQIEEAAVSEVASSQLKSLLDQNRNADFLVMYPQLKSQLRGKDLEHYAELASDTSDKVVNQALTSSVFAKFPDDKLAAKAYIDNELHLTGDQYDDVNKRLDYRYAEVEAAAKKVENDDLDAFEQQFYANGMDIGKVDQTLLARVNKHNARAVEASKAYAISTKQGRPIQTDSDSWFKWSQLNVYEKIDPKNSPLNFKNVWSEADFKHAAVQVAEIKALMGGFGKGSEKPTYGEKDIAETVKAAWNKAYPTKTDASADQFLQFDSMLRKRLDQYQGANAGKMPPLTGTNSVESYVAWALAEGTRVDAGIFNLDISGRRIESILHGGGEVFQPKDSSQTQEDPLDAITTVPNEYAAQISKALRDEGIEPTKYAVLDRYLLWLKKHGSDVIKKGKE